MGVTPLTTAISGLGCDRLTSSLSLLDSDTFNRPPPECHRPGGPNFRPFPTNVRLICGLMSDGRSSVKCSGLSRSYMRSKFTLARRLRIIYFIDSGKHSIVMCGLAVFPHASRPPRLTQDLLNESASSPDTRLNSKPHLRLAPHAPRSYGIPY